ncbi:MAG: hypothetical protein KDD45_16990 [Bdellovibrionales bacterium]|nr:hypothetical protein [Bdellovibrionales bacterium]
MNLTLLADLLGLEDTYCNEIDIRPKAVMTSGKGMFIISVLSSCPAALENKLYIRRVLVLRVKDTSCYFHFPL